MYQCPKPRNIFYPKLPVTTIIRIPGGFSTRQGTIPGLFIEPERATETKVKKHLPNKDQTRRQHLELQSSQTKMSRHQCKNTINNSQNTVPPLESSNSIKVGPENCNKAEAHDKDFNALRW